MASIGREINGPYDGTRVGTSRDVWQLHEEDWQAFRERVLHTLTPYGRVVFAGRGLGVNPFDRDSEEESACFILVTNPVGNFESARRTSIRSDLLAIGREYGQLEIGYTVGEYRPIDCRG